MRRVSISDKQRYDAQFISKETYEQIYADCRKLGAGILNFIKSVKSFDSKGSKYE